MENSTDQCSELKDHYITALQYIHTIHPSPYTTAVSLSVETHKTLDIFIPQSAWEHGLNWFWQTGKNYKFGGIAS